MKKSAFLILLFISLMAELQAKQWIVFFAKEGFFDGILRQSFGHAYVGLVWEDPALKQKVLLDCFGFYPKGGIQIGGVFSSMDGEMRDDLASLREDDFAVEISEEELFSCLILKKVWANKKYCLMSNNCIDFIKNYCRAIPKLKLPEGYFLLPSNFLEALRDENKQVECKGQLNNVVEMDLSHNSKFGFIKRQEHLIQEKFKKIKWHKLKFFSRNKKGKENKR